MNSDKFEERMRALETYHSIKFPPHTWVVIRIDGRSFSNFTEKMNFKKPFDPAFSGHMINTTSALLNEFKATYAFTESDEISLLLPPEWDLFDRELEKIVSVSAAAAASKMTELIMAAYHSDGSTPPPPIMFDSRVCICPNEAAVTDYFRWRQSDANRCAINGYCYWTLRQEGQSARKATSALAGKTQDAKMLFLKEKGIEWDKIPGWQRNGTGLYWTKFMKSGKNPITGQSVEVERRIIKVDHDIPVREDYEKFLSGLMGEATVPV